MKNVIICFLLAAASAVMAQSPYDSLYANLPIEIERVQPVVFPDTTVNLKTYFKQHQVLPLTPNATNAQLATEAIQQAIDELAKAGGVLVV